MEAAFQILLLVSFQSKMNYSRLGIVPIFLLKGEGPTLRTLSPLTPEKDKLYPGSLHTFTLVGTKISTVYSSPKLLQGLQLFGKIKSKLELCTRQIVNIWDT